MQDYHHHQIGKNSQIIRVSEVGISGGCVDSLLLPLPATKEMKASDQCRVKYKLSVFLQRVQAS